MRRGEQDQAGQDHAERDQLARTRFFALAAMRLAGIFLLGFGLAVWRTDLLRPGGWPAVGIPLAILGFLESLLLPKLFASRWRSPTDL